MVPGGMEEGGGGSQLILDSNPLFLQFSVPRGSGLLHTFKMNHIGLTVVGDGSTWF
jgi:hypothetical protein